MLDFKVNHEIICTADKIFDGVQEQSVELDYILPDYQPEIFKIKECTLTPSVTSYHIDGGKLGFELSVCVKLIYCTEEGGLRCVDRKLSYSRTAELSRECENPWVIIRPETDYVNCRAVNPRRIDLRGAVSCKIKVYCDEKKKCVSDVFGLGVKLKKQPFDIVAERLNSAKTVTVTEELDIGYSKPPITAVVKCRAHAEPTDRKVIADKMVVKGKADIYILYSCMKDGEESLEPMEFTLPFSQVMDMSGVDERYGCIIDIGVAGCEIICKGNEGRKLECELSLLISCTASRSSTEEFAVDAYSTDYNCSCEYCEMKLQSPPMALCDSFNVKATVEESGGIGCIFDVGAKVISVGTRFDSEKGKTIAAGTVCFTILGKDSEGGIFSDKSEVPFEYIIEGISSESISEISAEAVSVSYTMTQSGAVEAKAEIRLCGFVIDCQTVRIIGDISIDDSEKKKRENEYALKLYYAEKGEDIWEIAKRYSVSPDDIIDENELEGYLLPEKKMLLIPISA